MPPIRILIVDDDEDHLSTLARLLRLDGHRVECASTAPSALAIADGFYPELVLLDIGMPGIDGYETCRRIRREHGHDVAIVALTGWGQERDKQASAQAGFDLHLAKPADPRVLEQILIEPPHHARIST